MHQTLTIHRWTGEFYSTTIREIDPSIGRGFVGLSGLMERVSKDTGVSVREIRGKRGHLEAIDARFMFVAIAANHGYLRAEIDSAMHKAHGCAARSLKVHRERLLVDRKYKAAFEQILERLEA